MKKSSIIKTFNSECEKHCFTLHEDYFKFKDNPDMWGLDDISRKPFLKIRSIIDDSEDELRGYSYTTSLGDNISIGKTGDIKVNGI